jgi:branched-chain amino acid transport system permease protein
MTTAAVASSRLEARARTLLPWLLLAVLAILPSVGLTANIIRLLFITCVWVTASLGWNLLGGFTGQVSFGFAVFYGLGAYSAALLIDRGVNPYLSFLGAAVVPALASVFIGLPTFRLRGPYFAIATIGVSEATRVVMNNLDITGGASGFRIMEHRPFHQVDHYYTALVLAALAVGVSFLIQNSKFGIALRAIKQDEEAAADLGVNPYAYKLAIHAVAAALTGMAGGVFARYAAFIYPQGVFAFQTSIYILLMPVIGGIGTVWGAVLGGVVFGTVEEQLVANFPEIHLLLYGSLLILIILAEPDGLAGLLGKLFRLFEEKWRRPFLKSKS